MSHIWHSQNKFQKMLEVEVAACEANAKLGKIPKKALYAIKKKSKFNLKRIEELDKKTNHDVAAFVENLQENIGKGGEYIHMGLTSNDVTDTALALLMKEAADIILEDLNSLSTALVKKAGRYRDTVMIGRTHGVHAEPTTFGLKMALFYQEINRNIVRMEAAKKTISVGKVSGAVGTFSNLEPEVETYVCKKLELAAAPISNQVLQRDRHAEFLTTIAIIGGTLEKLATEIRGLQRTEILEAEEYFSETQKGSSAMPHKRNPIACERICGLARVLRANGHAAIENIALWHERDISHSSVERIIIPDSTILLDYMLTKMTNLVNSLGVNAERMRANINKTSGIIFSQRILLELIKRGLTRLEAYDIVQTASLNMREEGIDFEEALRKNKKVRNVMGPKAIEECFDLSYHTRCVYKIFRKVGI